MKKRILIVAGLLVLAMVSGAGCGSGKREDSQGQSSESAGADTEESTDTRESSSDEKEPVNILIAAAASLEYSLEDELIPMFEEEHPEITVKGTYDSSGKLQTQIEEGLEADLFFSAATAQMDALTEEGFIQEDTVTDLLENKIVLIVAKEKKETLPALKTLPRQRRRRWGILPVFRQDSMPRKPLQTWDCGMRSLPKPALAPM